MVCAARPEDDSRGTGRETVRKLHTWCVCSGSPTLLAQADPRCLTPPPCGGLGGKGAASTRAAGVMVVIREIEHGDISAEAGPQGAARRTAGGEPPTGRSPSRPWRNDAPAEGAASPRVCADGAFCSTRVQQNRTGPHETAMAALRIYACIGGAICGCVLVCSHLRVPRRIENKGTLLTQNA